MKIFVEIYIIMICLTVRLFDYVSDAHLIVFLFHQFILN